MDVFPPEDIRGVGRGDFRSLGRMWRELLTEWGLRPEHRVLDAGCGVGRIAIPLTGYITTGSYEGFDVSPEMVGWCRENISPRFPNFQFQVADLLNKAYNREGRQKASEYRFPYEDASFDFAYLTSVFTHMLPKDVDHYISEVARVLGPGGRCVITYFLLNDQTINAAKSPAIPGMPRFRYRRAGYRIESWRVPERAVAHDEVKIRAMYVKWGLEIDVVEYGKWSGAEGRTGQDVIVADK